MTSARFNIVMAIHLLLASSPLPAADFHAGVSAYEKGDLQAALRAWRPAADQGDALAQYNLGALYARGRGVGKDLGEAAKWFRLAAEQGNGLAEYYLAMLYVSGNGVARDTELAAHWFRKAATHGVVQAQAELNKLTPR